MGFCWGQVLLALEGGGQGLVHTHSLAQTSVLQDLPGPCLEQAVWHTECRCVLSSVTTKGFAIIAALYRSLQKSAFGRFVWAEGLLPGLPLHLRALGNN